MTLIRHTLGLMLIGLLASAPGYAAASDQSPLTVDQIIALSRGGVSDAVIIAMINRDKPVFAIDSRKIARFRQDCLSAPLILAMVSSGRPLDSQQAIAVAPMPFFPAPSACATVTIPVAPPSTSTRGIFFTQPASGIFFTPSKR